MEGKICQVYDLMKANLNLDMGNHENEALLWQIPLPSSSFLYPELCIQWPNFDQIAKK